jgi:hypothetical protein
VVHTLPQQLLLLHCELLVHIAPSCATQMPPWHRLESHSTLVEHADPTDSNASWQVPPMQWVDWHW